MNFQKYEQNMEELWDHMKGQLCNYGQEEAECHTKGIENIFNKILGKNFSNLKNSVFSLGTGSLQTTKMTGPGEISPHNNEFVNWLSVLQRVAEEILHQKKGKHAK